MVYLEHSGSKFWRCVVDGSTVHTTFGKVGTAGRSTTKEFDDATKAEDYLTKQEASKRKGNYVDAPDPNHAAAASTPPPKKRGNASITPSPSTSVSKSKKAGLGGFAAPDAADGKVVDSGVAGIDGALASRAVVHEEYHARLALVDPAQNSDKYYILQVLVDERPAKKQKGGSAKNRQPQYYLFTRWGRTGTGGQAKLEGPFDEEDQAKASFEKIFKSKTAVAWKDAEPGSEPEKGKYEYLAVSTGSSNGDGHWFYYLENDPMGKPDGWYAYDEHNNDEVEELHDTYLSSLRASRLAQRVVSSESSGYQYRVDLSKMQQTNTSSGKTRPIARTLKGKPPATAPTPASTPTKTTKKKAVVTPAPKMATAAAAPPKAAGKVDKAVSSMLKNGTVEPGYDVMLNQTNLGANNNKFYKIQLIHTPAGYTLFTKWGRVGEDGQTQEQGPFSDLKQAHKEFAKKFRAKSANKWEDYQHDKNSFVSKKGKYTVVEMEDDEEAVSAMTAAVGSNKPIAKSNLDADTKQLVDLIFDEDMFNSAMTAMNLDPKKLPLGALSQGQIAKGFSVLEQLEDAIHSNASKTRLEDITSEFYTLIPHAFGRSRGPVLDTMEKLREKYEMLNTLADIETAQSMQKTKGLSSDDDDDDVTQPNPSDLNYKQLAADLTLLDPKKDKDFKLIKTYFEDTKDDHGPIGGMKLRRVWRVNRHKEEQRFRKHAAIEERKLLWHGTGVAVVAAILKSGLRIMPHSGGRVGRGK
jgi:poly [ADP-ribose] polymerase 2/3/4